MSHDLLVQVAYRTISLQKRLKPFSVTCVLSETKGKHRASRKKTHTVYPVEHVNCRCKSSFSDLEDIVTLSPPVAPDKTNRL